MTETNIYKEASKANLTFAIPTVGTVGVNDLWMIDLKALDNYAATLHGALDSNSQFSLLTPKRTDKKVELQFAILVDVVTTRQEEAKAAKERQAEVAQRYARKQLLLQAIEAKQTGEVMEMSLEDLQKQLSELD